LGRFCAHAWFLWGGVVPPRFGIPGGGGGLFCGARFVLAGPAPLYRLGEFSPHPPLGPTGGPSPGVNRPWAADAGPRSTPSGPWVGATGAGGPRVDFLFCEMCAFLGSATTRVLGRPAALRFVCGWGWVFGRRPIPVAMWMFPGVLVPRGWAGRWAAWRISVRSWWVLGGPFPASAGRRSGKLGDYSGGLSWRLPNPSGIEWAKLPRRPKFAS